MSSIRFDHYSLIGGENLSVKNKYRITWSDDKHLTIQQLLARFYDGNIAAYNVREGGKERFDRK